MKTTEELMIKALDKMDFTFTSNEFCKKAKELGIEPYFVSNDKAADFLYRYCDNNNSRRLWVKMIPTGRSMSVNNLEQEIEKAIKLLKDNGYKILKPTFQEI